MILVTGGAGYIGSHSIVELLRMIMKLSSLIISSTHLWMLSKIENISNKKVTIYEGDVCDRLLLKKIFSEHSITDVIHFAGLKSVSESILEPVDYYQNNVTGTLILVSEMLNCNIHNLIFSSSATVCKNRETIPLTESSSGDDQPVWYLQEAYRGTYA